MLALVLALSLSGTPAVPAPPPPAGGPAAPAPPQAGKPAPARRQSVAALRRACYGGPGEKLRPGVVAEFDRMAGELMLKNDFENAAHWFRRALQGGSEDAGSLRRLGVALEGSRKPENLEAAKACGDLLERVYPPPPAKK